MRQVRPRADIVAAIIGLSAAAVVLVLGTYDAAATDHRYLPAPSGPLLVLLIGAACVVYGFGRGERRALWLGAVAMVLTIAGAEVTVHILGAGDVGRADTDDPVMSPVIWLFAVPVFVALIAAGLGLRRWRDR